MPRNTDRPATGRGLVVWSAESPPVVRADKPRDVFRVVAPAAPARSIAPSHVPTPRPAQTPVAVSSRPSPAKQAPLPPALKPVPVRPVRAPAPAMWSAPAGVASVDVVAPLYPSPSPTSSPSAFSRWLDAPPAPGGSTYQHRPAESVNDQPYCATDFRMCRGTGPGSCLHGTCALCLEEEKGTFQRLLAFLYGLVKRSVSKAVAHFERSP
jgi:hypothetical protein